MKSFCKEHQSKIVIEFSMNDCSMYLNSSHQKMKSLRRFASLITQYQQQFHEQLLQKTSVKLCYRILKKHDYILIIEIK